MERYLCIHGHFYQPPRENAWLEDVELQDSAYPYHDWNERVTAEGYAPNAASRILDHEKYIIDIVNNYTKISFNFGPTLLSWMEEKKPDIYRSIIEADKVSQNNFSGHGSAIAQAYNHLIMPLANANDKRTQVIWGIRDFEHRFGRKPEGMWLPETAVDLETLTTLAEYDIKFTILAPHQAARMRKIGEEKWQEVEGGTIDPRMPYRCHLPSGKSIALFFYDGPISQEIGFGTLLDNGEEFANRLVGTFTENEPPQLVHIATDGETYGHHRRYGEMALSYCLHHIETNDLAQITIYGKFLEKFPPTHEVEIIENTSWSCAHGVERWKSDCGCNSGMHGEWNQAWREPLREAMDWLRDELFSLYETEAITLLKDPWLVRNEFIKIILDRSVENVEQFFAEHATKELSSEEKVKTLKLLEMQRHAMLMYTSCGWFFDDISGIETTQVLQYAARAIQLAEDITEKSLEPEFIKKVEAASSNIQEFKNGGWIYQNFVQPARLDLLRVGAHFAISSIFEEYQETSQIYCYKAESRRYELLKAGQLKLALGQAHLRSDITWNEEDVCSAVLHLTGHNLNGAVRKLQSNQEFTKVFEKYKAAIEKSDIPEILRLMDEEFGTHNYTLWHLFRDERKNIFDRILESRLEELEVLFKQIYEDDYSTMQAMQEMNIPIPKAMTTTLEYSLNLELQRSLESDKIELDQLNKLVEECKKWNVKTDKLMLSLRANQRVYKLMIQLFEDIQNLELMKSIEKVIQNLEQLSLDLVLRDAQNIYFFSGRQHLDQMKKASEKGDEFAQKWIDEFKNLGFVLGVKIA